MDAIEISQTAVNVPRTQAGSDTKLTHARSPDVRGWMLSRRRKVGAYTPAGHRCSNLLEQLENMAKSTDPDQIKRLEKSIGQSVAELAALSSSDPKGDSA